MDTLVAQLKGPGSIANRLVTDPRFDGMNKTEKRFALWLELDPNVSFWKFEAIKFRIAKNTYYTPDFWVVMKDGTYRVYEVKGFWRDDARVKWKAVAAQWPEFRWFTARIRKAPKEGWELEEYQR